jgi:YfiH family protein
MPFRQVGPLRLFEFASLDRPELLQAAFTRHGGTSDGPWASLNVGATVGDYPEHVTLNRSLCYQAVGCDPNTVFDVWQVHSTTILRADGGRRQNPPPKADGMVTDRPGVVLFMRFADCVPLLLYDPKRRAIGLAHAGWQGTLAGVGTQLVATMHQHYGSQPGDLMAGIGPSIAADHYPVGDEVVALVRQRFGLEADAHLHPHNGQLSFDLWSANAAILRQAGVSQIEISGECTACAPEDWYSHRAQHGQTGRFGVFLGLRP